jgi:hypothetical protein
LAQRTFAFILRDGGQATKNATYLFCSVFKSGEPTGIETVKLDLRITFEGFMGRLIKILIEKFKIKTTNCKRCFLYKRYIDS